MSIFIDNYIYILGERHFEFFWLNGLISYSVILYIPTKLLALFVDQCTLISIQHGEIFFALFGVNVISDS